MHDPKFEREVQQKMEELEFSPSEGVWANLQRELHKEKRRMAPLLWLAFLLGGMLLGAGGATFFYFHRLSHMPAAAAQRKIGTRVSPETAAKDTQSAIVTKTAGATGTANVAGKRGATGTAGVTGVTEAAEKPGTAGLTVTAGGSARVRVTRAANDKRTNDDRAHGDRAQGDSPYHDRAYDDQARGRAGSTNGDEFSVAGAVAVTAPLAPIQTDPGPDPVAGWNKIGSSTAAPGVPDLYKPADSRAEKKARFSDKPVWEAGYTGGGGISSISMSQPVSSTVPANLAPNGSTAPGILARQSPAPVSGMRPDLSFWAGIFVRKPVFKKLSLTIGLNLHYYSTRLPTGRKVADSGSTARYSLFNASPYVLPTVSAQTYPYYATGNNNEYRNRYYFMEIPVSLLWQVNRSRRTPISWEGGLSLSRLVSANALYYNEKSGVYVSDGAIANPIHLMAFTSVMIGFSWRGNLIQMGPEGQYGLTSLLNVYSAGSQHLVYGGIKIAVTPRKW